ncbi:unnamed protein product [Schistosoma spindalis]|nr:unnamed protein product [Schistosoma spindale]
MCGVGFCRRIHQNLCICLAIYTLFEHRIPCAHCHDSDATLNKHSSVLFASLTNDSKYMDKEMLANFLKSLHLYEESPHENDSKENKCFTASEMFDLFSPNHSHLNQTDFYALLPTIVYELKSGVCKHNHAHEVVPSTHEFSWRAFLAAVGAVFLVSFSGLIVVCLVPLMSRSFYNVVTQFLIALAVGSLAGDAFLHLIPHAFSGAGHVHHNHDQETNIVHEHIDEHHHESISSAKLSSHRKMILEALIALLGIYIFFLTERLTIICQNKMSRRKLKRQQNTALNESQMCNCSPERPMDNSRCVDYLNEKQISGSDGANQPHWSFNNNTVPPLDSVEAVANIEQQHFGGGAVIEGHYTKLSDLRKSSVHNNNKNTNNDNKQTSVLNNGGSLVDMLDVKNNSKQNNTTLELANHANNTTSQISKSNSILKKNSSFDYIRGGEQIQTHPHRDKPHGHHHGHSHDLSSVRAIAYTIIAGDGLHNFCDGIAIGAAFANDMRGGLSTSIAVLCHELPHELGDFAVLLHAGMSVKSALFYNLLSSILCAAGMIIGFLLGGMHSLDTWIFMLAAGMFIYIALVDMMPELSANQLKGNRRCHQPSVLFIWQNFGILLGFCIMLLIAFYEFEFISH